MKMKSLKYALSALLLVLCFTLLFTACGGDSGNGSVTTEKPSVTTPEPPETTDKPTGDETKYTIVVKDQNGAPVEGAVVEIYEGETLRGSDMSDAEGAIIFRFKPEGGQISLRFNANDSVDGYLYPTEPTLLPEGQTRALLQVGALTTYRVIMSDIMGEKLSGMRAELYSAADNTLVETKVSDDSGIITFTVSGGKYYVKVLHDLGNSAFVFINPDEEGGNTKTLDPKNPDFTAEIVISSAEIPYGVTVKDTDGKAVSGAEVTFYDSDFEPVATAVSGDSGLAELTVRNGSYIAVVKTANGAGYVAFTENGAVNGELTVKADSFITVYGESDLSLVKGKSLELTVADAYKKTVTLSGSGITVNYGGKSYTLDGKTPVTLELTEGKNEPAVITLGASDAAELKLTVKRPGSHKDPIVLTESELDGMKLTASLLPGELIYYTFAATKDSTLEIEGADALINGRPGRCPVSAGETVTVAIGSDSASSVEAQLKYGQVVIDYTDRTQISMEDTDGVTVVLFDYKNGEYVKLAEGVTEGGVFTFKGLVETDRYYVKVEYAKYGTVDAYVKLDGGENLLYLVHVEEGTQEHPFSVNTDADGAPAITTVRLEANGKIWYKLFLPSGYTMTVDSKKASVTVWTDTNMNVAADSGDASTKLEWNDELGAYVHVFENRAAEDGRIMVFVELSAESETDVSIVFTAPVEEPEN
jgi:hypothetical protein